MNHYIPVACLQIADLLILSLPTDKYFVNDTFTARGLCEIVLLSKFFPKASGDFKILTYYLYAAVLKSLTPSIRD